MPERGRPRSFDRTEALEKAMDLFWRKGFDNASIGELTAATGLAPPSLYAAFGNKEALFGAALDHYARTAGSGIWERLDQAPTAREGVRALLAATAERYTRTAPPRGCMIVLAAPQMEGGNAVVAEMLAAQRRRNAARIEQRLRRAVATGELPPAADCRAIAAYVACVQHGMSIQARDGASREDLRAVADCVLAGWEALLERSAAARGSARC